MGDVYDEKQVYLRARELPVLAREEYLRTACPSDEARRAVLELLERDEKDEMVIGAGDAETVKSLPEMETLIGRLRLVRKIDEGGMGVVYLAEHMELKKPFAVKFLKSNLVHSERAIAQFIEEAKKAAKLNHPAIVQVLDLHREGERTYIVSEFVEGVTLAEVARRESPLAAPSSATSTRRDWVMRVTQIVATIADALDCAHRNGIVHCDVKPSNILVDPQRGPRLSDFGIARYLAPADQPNYTATQLTPWYASPEQAAAVATPIDERSDIFSLGVVLYELLTSLRPFDGTNMHAILDAVRHHHPPMVRSVNRLVPRDLETICHKAIEKSPQHRYPTAAHMAADLRCVLKEVPIPTPRPKISRKVARWLRAHPRWIGAAVVAMLVAGMTGSILMQRAQAKQAWEAARCLVTCAGITSDTTITVRSMSTSTFEVGPSRPLERASDSTAWLLPGHYRLTLERPGFATVEVELFLPRAGEAATLTPTWSVRGDEPDMVLIPGGEYQVGRAGGADFERPRTLTIEPFWLDRHEVSNKQYNAFLIQTRREPPSHWKEFGYPAACEECPVVGITREDMLAYAIWAGKRLPTALEWEAAARTRDGLLHPWRDQSAWTAAPASAEQIRLMQRASWEAGRAVYDQLARPVDDPSIPPNALGLRFVFGNADELTGSIFVSPEGTAGQVSKGGSWMDVPESWDLSRTATRPINSSSMTLGFRCARSHEPNVGAHMEAK